MRLIYSKTCVKLSLSKRPKIGCQDQLLLNAGLEYCRLLKGAFCNTFDLYEATFVIKIFVWSILEWLFYTGFTVLVTAHRSR